VNVFFLFSFFGGWVKMSDRTETSVHVSLYVVIFH